MGSSDDTGVGGVGLVGTAAAEGGTDWAAGETVAAVEGEGLVVAATAAGQRKPPQHLLHASPKVRHQSR